MIIAVRARRRTAVSYWVVVGGLLLVLVIVGGVAMVVWSSSGTPMKYIADVQYTMTAPSTSYNYWNIAKDGVIMAGVSVAIAACGAETLGACAAAVPGIGAVIRPILNDDVETVSSDVTLYNIGNGTATSLGFTATTYSDQIAISAVAYLVGDLPPNQQTSVQIQHVVTVADVPAALWSAIQGKGVITFQVSNLLYGSSRP